MQAPHRTVWKLGAPRVGRTVRLSPCCLYYDHACIKRGPLKAVEDEGLLVSSLGDSSSPSDGKIVVQVNDQKCWYVLGCVEEVSLLKMHQDLFGKFSVQLPPRSDGTKGERIIGFREFCGYVTAMTGEPGTYDVYEAICTALGVFPSQGLTSGDFRRMYCEFEGDLKEDHCLAFGRTIPDDVDGLTV